MYRFICSLIVIASLCIPFAIPDRALSQGRPITPRGPLTPEEQQNVDIFNRLSPSVVHVTTIGVARDMFTLNVMAVPKGTGTGFVWDDQGHIVTNFHVIQGGSFAQVTFSDQSSFRAKIIGVAPERDLAVLMPEKANIKFNPIPIGTSRDLKVGQRVYAIGNPFGLDQTLTLGIISALGREIDSVAQTLIRDVIQTDAAINPGNSGGPLLDSAGRLIGVNTAIYSPTGASAGIGFAIPVDNVNWVVPELIVHGKVIEASLGVSLAPDRLLEQMDIQGALVLNIQPKSSAEEAGLRPSRRTRDGQIMLGDIITKVNQKKITSGPDLIAVIQSYRVGDKVNLTLLRDRRETTVSAVLGASK